MTTAANRVFEQTVSEILQGSLRPGDQISERYLVARFGVSRTPVREAIKRLFARGLVELGPKRVAVVSRIDGEDIHKLYAVRLMIEGYAAILTVSNITQREIAELRRINKRFGQALKQRNLARMLEVRAEFHAITAAATRNRWLAEIMAGLRERAYAVRHLHWQDPARAAETVIAQDMLIDALEAREAKRYRDLVVRQVRAALACYDAQLLPDSRGRGRHRPAKGTAAGSQPKASA